MLSYLLPALWPQRRGALLSAAGHGPVSQNAKKNDKAPKEEQQQKYAGAKGYGKQTERTTCA